MLILLNHYLSKDRILDYIDDAECLIRPYNISKRIGGVGSKVFDCGGTLIRVTNILGTAFMKEEVNSPYYALKSLIESLDNEDSIHIVDFHAEATGEKMCFGYIFDGLVSAVLGTHTHVQTNDAKILENGTAFISDVGMTGFADGILGSTKETVFGKHTFNCTHGAYIYYLFPENLHKSYDFVTNGLNDNTWVYEVKEVTNITNSIEVAADVGSQLPAFIINPGNTISPNPNNKQLFIGIFV